MGEVSKAEFERLEQQLVNHISQCEAKFERGERQFQQILNALSRNTEAVQSLDASTKDVRKAYNDVQAAARVGLAIQRFTVAVAKWGVAGTVLATGLMWVVERFLPPPGH